MSNRGVMRAHVKIVEIDTPVTELHKYDGGSYLGTEQASPLLEINKIDLDQYDHVFCVVSLDTLNTRWVGLTGSPLENGIGQTCINSGNLEQTLAADAKSKVPDYPSDYPI